MNKDASSLDFEPVPAFQTMQKAMTDFIRDPKHCPYEPVMEDESALPIEPRRLAVYQRLFFNNLSNFFSGIFPKVKQTLGSKAWDELIGTYVRDHQAQTPLFHELGQEFLLFLHSQEAADRYYPPYVFELAHYEWLELAMLIAPSESQYQQSEITADSRIRLAQTAWPVQYQWPVFHWSGDGVSNYGMGDEMPEDATHMLGYRTQDYEIHWMALTPALYLLVEAFDHNLDQTVQDIVKDLANTMNAATDEMLSHALTTLNQTRDKDLWVPVTAQG